MTCHMMYDTQHTVTGHATQTNVWCTVHNNYKAPAAGICSDKQYTYSEGTVGCREYVIHTDGIFPVFTYHIA